MTLRLTIDEHAWQAHVDRCREVWTGLVPVVKGNGYGIGRELLATIAAPWAAEIAVGTVHEIADVVAAAPNATVVALTPAAHLDGPLAPNVVPTVGSVAHVAVLRDRGWRGAVAVKLASSMRRHGIEPDGLADLIGAVTAAHMTVHQFVLHLPLATAQPAAEDAAFDETTAWLRVLDRVAAAPLSLGHVPIDAYERLRATHPDRAFRYRSGTSLWHGDKSFLHLGADVLEVRPIAAGNRAGYHRSLAAVSGHLVMVGAGSAHGVAALDDGRSPFHHARRRLALLEAPHMHTTMVLVPDGDPVPSVGDWVDVQRPLISATADEVVWR